MDIAVGATLATVAKKVLSILIGDKKGRKFLLYVIGIVLFIIFIPLITLIGLFGWMAGTDGPIIDQNTVLSGLPQEQQSQIAMMDETCDRIETHFETEWLPEEDQKKASAIYISYLVGRENEDNFYENLADCFLDTTIDKDVYDLVSEKFQVTIPEEDRKKMDDLYGITSIRGHEEVIDREETPTPTPPPPTPTPGPA